MTGDPRYVVVELAGYRAIGASPTTKPGVSCIVLDRLVCHRRVREFQSESFIGKIGRGQGSRDQDAAAAECRRQAAAYAENLNAPQLVAA